MTGRILIGFAESLAAIEVAVSLARAGYEVHFFSRESSLTALSSGYFGQQLGRIIAPEDDVESSLTELVHLWQMLNCPPIFPLDDISLWLANRLTETHPEAFVIGAHGPQANLALDKNKQIDCARTSGFTVPETISGDWLRDVAFPQFVKGCLAAEVRDGRIFRTGGCRIDSPKDFHNFADSCKGSPFICQCWTDGVGVGIFGIANNGRLLIASGHRRVRMMNPQGSGSSACESRHLGEDELEYTRRFIELTGWQGLFMLELLRDHSGTAWFMELNGRPWGSMALARVQGLDYPRWATDLALKGLEPDCSELQTKADFRIESRHLGRELLHLAHLARQFFQEGRCRPAFWSSVRGMVAPGRPVDYYNLSPAGWKIFLLDSLYCLARHSEASHLGRLITLPRKILFRLRSLQLRTNTSEERTDLHNRLAKVRKIAVVCYGNINRSAIAAAALTRALPPQIEVLSCGLHRRCGRPADPMMISIASTLGYDLSGHRSKTFTSVNADEADLILVMEHWHIVRLHARYPITRGKVFLLGLLDNGTAEIPDPYRKGKDAYLHVATRIAALAKTLCSLPAPD